MTWLRPVRHKGESMLTRIRKAIRREEGASAVEYGLLVAGIAVVIMAAVWFVGGSLKTQFNKVGSSISAP